MSDLDALLIEYGLGQLSGEERAQVEAALSRSPELRRELDALQGALAETVFALPAILPSPATKRRLLESVEHSSRYARFADRCGELFDLARQRMLEVFASAADPRRWEQAMPGVWLLHFQGGPKVSFDDVGLVRFAANLDFPYHRHKGDEYVFVLEGTFTELPSGGVHGPGELLLKPKGTAHKFKVGDSQLLIATAQYGIELIPEE